MTGEHIDNNNNNDEELFQIMLNDNPTFNNEGFHSDEEFPSDELPSFEELLNLEDSEFPPRSLLVRQPVTYEVWAFDPATDAWTVDYE